MEEIRTFTTYELFKQFCFEQTGSNPCEPGISLTLRNQTAILRSNDGTKHYPDDLSDINSPKYTLFGPSGDQLLSGRYNATLLNKNKIKHVFLYRVIKKKSKKQYLWYGKYNIVGTIEKSHVGLDGNLRKVILLQLKRIQGTDQILATIQALQALATVQDLKDPPTCEVPVNEEHVISINGLVDFDNESISCDTLLDSDEETVTLLDSDEETATLLDSDEEFDEDFDEDFEEKETDLQKILDVCSKITADMLELNNSFRK